MNYSETYIGIVHSVLGFDTPQLVALERDLTV